MTRRSFHTQLLALGTAALLPLPAYSADNTAPAVTTALIEGRDWSPVPSPQTPIEPNKIEVLEFFSYGCPHCAHLNPLLTAWAAKLPADVHLQRVPVTFGRAAWEILARLHFALEYSGDLPRLDQLVFDAVTIKHTNLFTEQDLLKWLAEQQVDADKFKTVLNSFEVATQLARAAALSEQFQVDAVPRLIIDGRYVVVGKEAKSQADLLTIADALIQMARASRQPVA